jgi:integral membrane sensor domain MASE1
MKQKIAFAFLMGIVTTALISFTVVAVNLGLVENFLRIWLKSWAIAYLIVVPLIIIIAPQIERLVGFLFKEKTVFKDRQTSV